MGADIQAAIEKAESERADLLKQLGEVEAFLRYARQFVTSSSLPSGHARLVPKVPKPVAAASAPQESGEARSAAVSAASAVESILRETGKPMTLGEIIPRLRAKGFEGDAHKMYSWLFTTLSMRRKDLFVKKTVNPTKFGLTEWEKKEPSEG